MPMAFLQTDEEVKQIESGKLTLCGYASIHYYDIAEVEHEFRFCYLYRPKGGFGGIPPGFYLGGPKEYNKQT